MPSNKGFDWSQLGGQKIEKSSPSFDWSAVGGTPIGKSSSSEALRHLKRVGRMGATGLAGIADIPNLAAYGLHAAGLKEDPTFYEPVAGRVQTAIDRATKGELKPRNKFEEYQDIIGEGLAPLALAPFTGGASLTGTGARLLSKAGPGVVKKAAQKIAQKGSNPYALTGSNIAGTAGSSAALKAYMDEYGDPGFVGSLLASQAGNAGARGLYKLKNPANALAEGVGKVTRFSPEKYAQNEALGLPMSVATVSKGKIPSYGEMIASKIPGSMDNLEDFYKNREMAIARNLGVKIPEDLESSVRNIPKHLAKKGATGYHERASDIYKKREEKFRPREEAAIRNKETVDVSDIIGKLEHERSLHLTNASRKRFDRTPDGILLKELKESIPDTRSSEMHALITKMRKQNYPEDLIQKVIGAETGKSSQGVGLHDLNKLREKALQQSIDLKTPLGGGTPESFAAARRSEMLAGKRHQFMEEIGSPQEAHNARQARLFWSQYKNKEKGMSRYVEKLTGADNDADAFKKLTGKNPKYMAIARQGLKKEERPLLAQSIISDLGERQGRFSINTAYTGFVNLEEPVKQEFLKTLPTKAARHHFEKTMEFIGENKKMMDKLENTSRTAHTQHMLDLMKKYGSAAALAATGYTVMPLTGLLATYGGLKYGSKLWTDQNFLKRMNNVISAKSVKGQTNNLDLMFKSLNQVGRQTHTISVQK